MTSRDMELLTYILYKSCRDDDDEVLLQNEVSLRDTELASLPTQHHKSLECLCSLKCHSPSSLQNILTCLFQDYQMFADACD